MQKILCLMVVLSLLIVGCGEEKKEVKGGSDKNIFVNTGVEKSTSESSKDKQFVKLAEGMYGEDWTPESGLRFLNSFFPGKVTMIEETGRGRNTKIGDKELLIGGEHRFGNKFISTSVDGERFWENPNIYKSEGSSPEALYFIEGSEQPIFLLKYQTILFSTGIHSEQCSGEYNTCGVHIETWRNCAGKVGKVLLCEDEKGFCLNFSLICDNL